MNKPGDRGFYDLRNPEQVHEPGKDHGGPLKLCHRVLEGKIQLGEHLIVKWPSYSQWAGVGERANNPVEYYLVKVVGLGHTSVSYTKVELVKKIEPGRKRTLVKALVTECESLSTIAILNEAAFYENLVDLMWDIKQLARSRHTSTGSGREISEEIVKKGRLLMKALKDCGKPHCVENPRDVFKGLADEDDETVRCIGCNAEADHTMSGWFCSRTKKRASATCLKDNP
jgi:hypothetical protein